MGFITDCLDICILMGLDMDKVSVLCFQFLMNQKTFKEVFFKTLPSGVLKWMHSLCVLNFLAENCVVSSSPAGFASGTKNSWNLGILSSRDPQQGWPTLLGALSWSHISPLGWSLCPEQGQSSCGAWGTPAHGEGQPLGWV